ncbi:outer membrane protein assembly factor BamB family protein [Nocardia anaemiae]|uniref:outer membrane protein assembly factor BamB family protein n=1 Tax=Nocardia anaemiae TaxID=263910 RepID=UPI001FE130F6|nr:PQQ-binding-like beta-propeller repeat protein [Nocardia anaemiae]
MHGIDPDTGQVRWTTDLGELYGCREQVFDGKIACHGTNRVLIIEAATGAVLAVVGNTVIVRSVDGSQLAGLDLTDGHRIWQQPTPFSNASRYSRNDGITDASHLILTDGTTVHAINAGDGSTAWSMPLPPSGRPNFRSAVKAMGGRMVTVTAQEFTGYAAA